MSVLLACQILNLLKISVHTLHENFKIQALQLSLRSKVEDKKVRFTGHLGLLYEYQHSNSLPNPVLL
jgi:hypothetical protein